MAYKIDSEKCIRCGACVAMCQYGAISLKDGKYFIDPAKCQNCGACLGACPLGGVAQA